MNQEIPNVQAGFKNSKGNRLNCQHSLDHRKKREFQKDINLFFTDYTKAFDCVDHNTLWKILKEMETLHLPPEKPVCWSRGNS